MSTKKMPKFSKIEDIPAELARRYFHYDPRSGVITRTVSVSSNALKGGTVGCPCSRGYKRIHFCGKMILAHRLAWLLHFGVWPEKTIDHIDGDPSNNRIGNLRLASQAENNQNMITERSSGGLKGVYREVKSRVNPFFSQISYNNKLVRLGAFPTAEAAHEAYVQAKMRLHTHATERSITHQPRLESAI